MGWNNNEIDEVVLAGYARLKGNELKSGVERWVIEGVSDFLCTTPVVGDGMLYFAAFSAAAADLSPTHWEASLNRNDKNGDGKVDLEEIEPARRDYERGRDWNRDGKLTKEDWELRRAAAPRAENMLIGVKPGGAATSPKRMDAPAL